MGFWPFGGSKKNKSSRAEEKYREIGYESRSTPTPDHMARSEKQAYGAADRPSRTNSRRLQSDQSRKLSKMPADGKNSARGIDPRDQAASPSLEPPNRARTDAYDSRASSRQAGMYNQNIRSNSSLGPENFSSVQPIPTLRARRSEYNPGMPRRKSSKRKAEDQAREREVRNMSSPIPIPRETRNVPGDLNRKFERPTSEVSLPLPETFSEIETRSPANSFKVSPFAVLSPRPTVRYDANPRSGALSRTQLHSRLSVQQAVVEEDLSSSRKRIDDLADSLDSSGLRELMERDRKRRERKREDDKTKLQRKLQRRADRQKEDDTRRAQGDEAGPSTPSRRRVWENHDDTFSPDLPSSPPVTGDGDTEMHDSSPASRRADLVGATSDPFADPIAMVTESKRPIRNPFVDEKDVDEMENPFDHQADKEIDSEPKLPVRSPLREVRNEETPATPAAILQSTPPSHKPIDREIMGQRSPLTVETTPDLSQSPRQDRRGSDQAAQPVSAWASFFKRGKRQPSSTDRTSEFTNTSRESFSRQQPPLIVPSRDLRRSATPQRTQSKFREDLPELPMSPPDSRVQSPEVDSVHQIATLPAPSLDGRSLATSGSVPNFDRSRQESGMAQQRSADLQSADTSGPAPALSQSLASVDSEASWLSGRPAKRSSAQMGHPLRQSQSSLQPQAPGTFGGDDEGEGVVDDDFLNRLTPAPEDTRRSSGGSAVRKASSTVIDLRGEQDRYPPPELPPLPSDVQDEKWHSSVGRQPTVVKQARAAKSKEGLLKDFENDGNDTEDDLESPDVETPDVEFPHTPIMRATSVEYGKKGHSRVISAGSARLLDIRRASVQSENRTPGDRTSIPPQGPSTALE
jgi:hypothetical protein